VLLLPIQVQIAEPGREIGEPPSMLVHALTAAACMVLAIALSGCTDSLPRGEDPRADPRDAAKVAAGAGIYRQDCAACHGERLEGQPNWRVRLPNGRLPAPPHDESGHTWHHPDDILFGITKHGLVPGKYAPAGYESDMPAFAGKLSDDEIWAVLAYIKRHWTSKDVLDARSGMLRNMSRQP
jgi:mono/diheme cytochrome c family protein